LPVWDKEAISTRLLPLSQLPLSRLS